MLSRLGLNCARFSPASTWSTPRLKSVVFRSFRNHSQTYNAAPFSAGLTRRFVSASPVKATTLYVRRLGGAAFVASVGLGLAALSQPILCDPASKSNASPVLSLASTPDSPDLEKEPLSTGADGTLPPPPKSSLNTFELSFGAVCGICAGVFVKKGAKVLAFFFGGVFVILQYMASVNLIKVNWSGAQSRFDKAFSSTDVATGKSRPPTVYSLWKWLVNFLAADFPPRATFIAGFLLGIRIG